MSFLPLPERNLLLIILLLTLLLPGGYGTCSTAMAQWTMGGRNIALAQAHTALPSDHWALFHNPSLIGNERLLFGAFSIRYHGLKELEDHAAIVSFPINIPFTPPFIQTGMAAGIHTYGFDLYRETRLLAGWSFSGNAFRMGMSNRFVHRHIQGMGSSSSLLIDTGFSAGFNNGIHAGYRVTNLLESLGVVKEKGRDPAEMAAGVSWNSGTGLLLATDLIKDLRYPLAIRAAVELQAAPSIWMRMGWTSEPFTWSAGLGFALNAMEINLAIQHHEILGANPGADIIMAF